MSYARLKQLFVTSIDDTPSLRLARVVNQAEEAKVASEIRVYEKIAKIRYFELNREIELLEKFLEELKITTGYLKDTPIVNVW